MSLFLKIIAYFLLFLLLLTVLLLFYPISYRGKFIKDVRDATASIKGAYLFGAIRFGFCYSGDMRIYLKIFGFDVLKKRGDQKKEQKEKQEEQEDGKAESEIKTETKSNKKAENESGLYPDLDSGAGEEQAVSIKDKLQYGLDEFKFYKKLLEAEFTQDYLRDAFYRFVKIVRNLLPRKIKGNICFGASSPDITGLAMAGYSMLFYNRRSFKNVTFTPDFEQEILEGQLYLRGWINLFVIIWHGLLILFDSRLRRIRHVLKKHKEKNGKARE